VDSQDSLNSDIEVLRGADENSLIMIWKLSVTDRTAQIMKAQFMNVTTELYALVKVLFDQLFNIQFIVRFRNY
jgi:hypothetical protein